LVSLFRESRDGQASGRTGASALADHQTTFEEVALAERRLSPVTGVSQISVRRTRRRPSRADPAPAGCLARSTGSSPSGEGRGSAGDATLTPSRSRARPLAFGKLSRLHP